LRALACVGRKSVVSEIPPSVGLDQPRVAQDPEVLGYGRSGNAELVRQRAHAERPLREEPDDTHPVVHRKRPADFGDVKGREFHSHVF
jgi:hypothetical protein